MAKMVNQIRRLRRTLGSKEGFDRRDLEIYTRCPDCETSKDVMITLMKDENFDCTCKCGARFILERVE